MIIHGYCRLKVTNWCWGADCKTTALPADGTAAAILKIRAWCTQCGMQEHAEVDYFSGPRLHTVDHHTYYRSSHHSHGTHNPALLSPCVLKALLTLSLPSLFSCWRPQDYAGCLHMYSNTRFVRVCTGNRCHCPERVSTVCSTALVTGSSAVAAPLSMEVLALPPTADMRGKH